MPGGKRQRNTLCLPKEEMQTYTAKPAYTGELIIMDNISVQGIKTLIFHSGTRTLKEKNK